MQISIIKQIIYKQRWLLVAIVTLFVMSGGYYAYNSYRLSPQAVKKNLEKYITGQEQFFYTIVSDSNYVRALTVRRDTIVDKALQNLSSGYFSYAINDRGNPISIFWSTSQMFVNPADLKANDSAYVVNYQNGMFELVKKTVQADGKSYILATLIPLRWQYFVENKYLPSQFAGVSNIDKLYRLSTNAYEATAIKNSSGTTLFYIERVAKLNKGKPDVANTSLHILIVLLLILFIVNVSKDITVRYSLLKGFSIFLGLLLLLRIVVFATGFIDFAIYNLPVNVSPGTYVSLSNFLITTIFVFVAVAFLFFNRRRIVISKSLYDVIAIAGLCILSLMTIVTCDVFEMLLYSLQGSFDINNFFRFSFYTFVGFVILSFIILTFYYASWLVMIAVFKVQYSLPKRITIALIAGLLLLTFQMQSHLTIIKLATLLWLAGYLVLLHLRKRDMYISIFNSSFFLLWVIVFAVSVSALLVVIKKPVDIEQRKVLAAKLAKQADPYSENILRIAVNSLTDEFMLKNFNRFDKEDDNRYIKDSLVNANFSGYLIKFDTRIYTYDKNEKPLFNDEEIAYYMMDNAIRNSVIRYRNKSAEGLYFLKNNSSAYSYIYKKDVLSRDSGLLGHLFVVAKPKRYKTDAIYPELFRQPNDIQSELNSYAYAVYESNNLINYSTGYPFADTLSPHRLPERQFRDVEKNGYSELWYNASNNKTIILAKKDLTTAEFLTLFASLFLCIIFFVCLLQVSTFLIRQRSLPLKFSQFITLNIRTQVQTTIILFSLVSFIIIGFITIQFFVARFNSSTEEKLVKEIQVITNEIQDVTSSQLIFSNWDEIGTNTDIDRKIVEIAGLNNTDINLYDVNGNLKLSTQPYIFNRQILSSKMQPVAFNMLKNRHSVLYLQNEKIKNFSFVSIYAPVKNETDETIAYLNIPYLNSQTEVNQEISNLLVTLINLNAVIFVLAGVIAIFLTRSIISSLVQIGNKMRDFQFGSLTEKIEWKRNDEISVLVNAFNHMVHRLEESAAALAHSERAGAWQEMARQVAHEIKNPLTPMKLSAQYLQRAIKSNAPNVKELALRMTATLIEQTDQLAKIAGDFSNFANINQATPEIMNLSELLSSLCNLHTTGSDAIIEYEEPDEEFIIHADKTQISRLFTNLMKNAEEARKHYDDEVTITVRQHRKNYCVLVQISDTGTGIPADKQQHIFEPNFTTKSSGTGLGLAICKRITENAGGKIWFVTKEGEGTDFFVELPLITD